MQPLTTPWIGRTLARTYLLEQLLGEGGFGAVFKARHLRTEGTVAVKIMTFPDGFQMDMAERFRNEARAVSRLRHPHIAQLYDYDIDDDTHTAFLVMEFLEGEDLASYLSRIKRMEPAEVVDLAQQIGSALIAVHGAGIVHRDIKPQNIFVLKNGINTRMPFIYKLLDFGISKMDISAPLTGSAAILGTPQYMAPEIARSGAAVADHRADQFSLAVVLYEALAGRPPFRGDNMFQLLHDVVYRQADLLQNVCPEIPKALASSIHRAMDKDRGNRYGSVQALLDALTGPEGPPLDRRKRERGQRSPVLTFGILAFLLASVCVSELRKRGTASVAASIAPTGALADRSGLVHAASSSPSPSPALRSPSGSLPPAVSESVPASPKRGRSGGATSSARTRERLAAEPSQKKVSLDELMGLVDPFPDLGDRARDPAPSARRSRRKEGPDGPLQRDDPGR